MSFVSKAILWDRGLNRYTARANPNGRPVLCPRFLSHMKAHPEDLLGPPRFPSSTCRPQLPPQGRRYTAWALSAPRKTQTIHGVLWSDEQNEACLARGERSAVTVPCVPVSYTPSPVPTINPTPPRHITSPNTGPGRRGARPNRLPVPPSSPQPAPEEREDVAEERDQGPQRRSRAPEPDQEHSVCLEEPELTLSPASRSSEGLLSDFSRPPSSQFSRSTDLSSGCSSVLSADVRGTDSACSPRLSQVRCSSSQGSPTRLSPGPTFPYRLKQLTPDPATGVLSRLDPSATDSKSTNGNLDQEAATGLPHQDTRMDLGLDKRFNSDLYRSLDADAGLIALASPSATWSSCPSPQNTTPRSGRGARPTPSASAGWQDWTSRRCSVLPPISPVRGYSGRGSCRTEISCSQSHVFDELEDIAPRSASCQSLDRPLSSSGSLSPGTAALSPGLAALTVGCDSGNMGSLSRVHLLLLERSGPESFVGPSGQDFAPLDWTDHRMPCSPQWTTAGDLRPLTAGSGSERCGSTGEVQEHKLENCAAGSMSQSSWITDPIPSDITSRSSGSCHQSSDDGLRSEGSDNISDDHYSGTDCLMASSSTQGGPTEETNYPEGTWTVWRRPEGLEHWIKDKERRAEERKRKMIDMLSRLQDSEPHRPSSSHNHSNFEDFDFLAKYCIFSQEKLAEYKRAFEAVDTDGDGYISCLQVLLALKNLIPAELLSADEEIYIYRILEMVDFRVTDGLTDVRLFAVIASLAQKIATMDEFMRSLIRNMDFRSLELKLFKAKQLFMFLLEGQAGGAVAQQQGLISADQLLVELKAGGIHPHQEAAVREELRRVGSLDLMDFLAYLPLFILIHNSVIANPLDDSTNL